MKRNFKISLWGLALAAAVLPGCKKFLDVNDNPNSSLTAGVEQTLPTTIAANAFVTGQIYQIYGGFWSQYWTQSQLSNQYKDIDSYSSVSSDFNGPWNVLYAQALSDGATLIAGQGVERTKNYAAIGYAMRAYSFQLLTDAFGDIPLSDALKGDQNLSPKYDPQAAVYDSIFVWLTKAATLADPDSDFAPGNEDLIFQGDMEQWQRFANTLKLRAYLRLSEVNAAKARAGVEALYRAGAEFLDADAEVKYTTVGGNQNPLYTESFTLQASNIRASSTAVEAFEDRNDPRVGAYYGTQGGIIAHTYQGSYDTTSTSRGLSRPHPNVGGDIRTEQSALAPVKLISAAESYFLQAEAVARGWSLGEGDAAALYNAGIDASFDAYGVSGSATYRAQASVAYALQANKIQAIITQKYFAMCGNQSFEAWSEYRRTGFPNFLVVSYASTLPAGERPARWLYPQTELTRNANFPGLQAINAKVWWDK